MITRQRGGGERRRRGLAAQVGLLGAVALCVVACGGDPILRDEPRSPFTYAMNGEPAAPGAEEPAVFVVKIDDTEWGRPQEGLKQADLVIQEPVEGGLTRLAAFYESQSPTTVGPVRSIRATDIGLVQPVRATVVTSGGATHVLEKFDAEGIPIITEGDPGVSITPDRVAPYDKQADLEQIREANPDAALPRQPYLPFGEPSADGGKKVDRVGITFSGSVSNTWLYDSHERTWQRQEQDSVGFEADTLIVLEVKLDDAGYRDSAGTPVPEVVTSGEGSGRIVSGNHVTRIRWSKDSETDPYVFTTPEGDSVAVTPGRTWISLTPEATGGVSLT